jgi:tRNA(His) 5'-end guanylyltransferase
MAAQSMFSQKQLHGKNTSVLQDMMMEKGVNWNDYPTQFKRGSGVIKKQVKSVLPSDSVSHKTQIIDDSRIVTRNVWEVDKEIPIFTQDREYILSKMRFDVEELETV